MVTLGSNPLSQTEARPRVLVTGATGGLGQALCRLALHDWRPAALYALARNASKLEEFYTELERPPEIVTRALDFMAEESLEEFATELRRAVGGIDVWLHCVGTLHGPNLKVEKSLRDLDAAAMTEAFRVNTMVFLLLAKHLKPLFRHEGGALIAALSAKVGSIGDNQLGGWYSYRMSKAALNMAVRNVALEFNRSGSASICVAIHPGTTATALSQPYTEGYAPAKLYAPELSAERILQVVKGLKADQNGAFLNWDGAVIPW